MQITVQAYTPKHIRAMTAIWNEVVDAGQAFPQEKTETEASAEGFFATQSHCGVACNDDGVVIGLYILHPNNIGRCGHICNASYAVSAKYRGCGVGKALVRDSLKVARNLGFEIMQFNAVAADNAAANKLYLKLGFKKLGQIPGGFKRPSGEKVAINLYYFPLNALAQN